EKNRVPQQDLSLLLLNAVFHKCLLICAVEVVMATYRTPWVSLLPEENYAPSEVHLQHIENRILDSLAWQAGSPLFDQLTRCEVSLLPIRPQPTEPTVGLSPVRHLLGFVQARHLSMACHRRRHPTRHQLVHDIEHCRPLSICSSTKVCRLAHHRMLALCGLLGIPKDIQVRVWTCLECCITRKAELLKDRHLDQIVMCSIYAVCKVAHTEIKFKTIVAMYRTLLHAGHHMHRVYKQVLVMPGEFDTIIAFYNRVFMPALKSRILQFSTLKVCRMLMCNLTFYNRVFMPAFKSRILQFSTLKVCRMLMCNLTFYNRVFMPVLKSRILQFSTLKPGLSPRAASTGLLNASPVYELAGRKNFYISPMKDSPFQVPQSPSQLTPNSAKLYCTVGDRLGSAEKFRQINKCIRLSSPVVSRNTGASGVISNPRSQKRLKFEEPVDTATDSADSQFEQPIVVKRIHE
ncbi:Retinoblastoma-associated protein, partial [Lamellibrachia satsuma]